MLQHAADKCRARGIPAQIIGNVRYELAGTKRMRAIFDTSEAERRREEILDPNGPIWLVCDDIRRREVLSAILGNTEINSASLMMTGGYVAETALEPYELLAHNNDDEMQRIAEIDASVCRGAVQFASRHVSPGGVFLYVEKGVTEGQSGAEPKKLKWPKATTKDHPAGIDAGIGGSISRLLGDFAPYWDPEFQSAVLENLDRFPNWSDVSMAISPDDLKKIKKLNYSAFVAAIKQNSVALSF